MQDYDVEMGEGPDTAGEFQKWSRPNLPPLNPAKDPVIFQQIDIDHYTGNVMSGMPGAQVRIKHYGIKYILLTPIRLDQFQYSECMA